MVQSGENWLHNIIQLNLHTRQEAATWYEQLCVTGAVHGKVVTGAVAVFLLLRVAEVTLYLCTWKCSLLKSQPHVSKFSLY